MSQIFNRIADIFKANFNIRNSNYDFLDNEDDELRKIIDDLNNDAYNKSEINEDIKDKRFNDSLKILGLKGNPTFNEIKLAHKKKIVEFHPDKAEKFDENKKREFLKMSQAINEAFSYLKKYHGK